MYFLSKKLRKSILEISETLGLAKEKVAMFLMGFIAGMVETNLELIRVGSFPNIAINDLTRRHAFADSRRIYTLNLIKTKLGNASDWHDAFCDSLKKTINTEKKLSYTDTQDNEWFGRGATIGTLYAYLLIFEIMDSNQAYDEMKEKILPSQDYQEGIKKSLEFAKNDLKHYLVNSK